MIDEWTTVEIGTIEDFPELWRRCLKGSRTIVVVATFAGHGSSSRRYNLVMEIQGRR